MLKFFRPIRIKLIEQDNVRKYILYAIGEIMLVVIGILIALQVNNWNEVRKGRIKSVEYHARLIEDLERTIRTSENLQLTSDGVLTSIKHTVELLNSKIEPTAEDKEQIDYAIIWVSRFNYQFSEMSTYDEMKSNGELSLIFNLDTRNKLINFVEYVVSVDEIFNRLGSAIANNQSFMSKYIQSVVDPKTLSISNDYDFMEMANDKEFINEFSRLSVHWRGNAFFTKQVMNRAIDLKVQIEADLKNLD